MTMLLLQPKPYTLNASEGLLLECIGATIYVKATSKQTDGAFNLFEVCCPPSFAVPLHIHYAEDVAVFVLEGALTFFWGNEKEKAAIGSFFFQPRGTPHGFRTEGSVPARILYMTIPAGLDQFVMEQQRQTSETEIGRTAARFKIEILGPLPDGPEEQVKNT